MELVAHSVTYVDVSPVNCWVVNRSYFIGKNVSARIEAEVMIASARIVKISSWDSLLVF